MRYKIKRPIISFLLILTILTILPLHVQAQPDEQVQPDVSAQSSILMDAFTGTVLYEKDADSQMLIASTTKIMTALVVIENCNLEDTLTVKTEYTLVEGSSMYLKAGEKLKVRDVLYGLMLSSGNDAAVALACHIAGSIEDFAEIMNAKAKQLGMSNSSFKNPHGLDTDGHYSTAKDMAVLTVAAMNNYDFAQVVSTKSINVAGRYLTNHNKLLWKYDGALGVKTGFTKSAGRSLVSCAERDGMRLVCVTLNAPDDWDDHSALYNWGFENYKYECPIKKGQVIAEVPVISGQEDTVQIVTEDGMSLLLGDSDTVETVINAPKFIYAGIESGQNAGSIAVIVNGEVVQEIGLIFNGDAKLDESESLTFWEQVKWKINNVISEKFAIFN